MSCPQQPKTKMPICRINTRPIIFTIRQAELPRWKPRCRQSGASLTKFQRRTTRDGIKRRWHSKMHPHRQEDGVADKIIRAVGGLSRDASGCRGAAAGHRARRAVSELVSQVDVEAFDFDPRADAEE